MPQYLRAFLFDSTQTPAEQLIENVFSTWSNRQAVSIIPATYPKLQIDTSIIRCDPSEVIDLADGSTHKRNLAIVDTPDLAAVVLTSGTTGDPLPVELGFESMKSSVNSLYRKCNLRSTDTWLCCVPVHYIAGLAILARCYISKSKLIFHPTFDTKAIQKSIEHNSVTSISLVATQLRRLLNDNVDLSSLKTILVGGGKFDDELKTRCKELNLNVFSSYGMTETWGGICIDGEFLDNTQGRVVNDQLELTSGSLMLGYRHNYPATIARLTPDHWFKTKDRAEIIDGILKINGRMDDLIISGGIKIDPLPLEETIKALFPGHELHVIATDHDSFGQSSTVCFLNSDSTIPQIDEIRIALTEHLPSTHMPLRTATIESFPKTESGKIQRNEISKNCKIIDEHLVG